MKNMKRFLALGLAFTMSFSMAAYANAETTSGSVDGDSYLEGVLPEDVVSVVLPTEETLATTYNFVLDPANLLKQYDAKADKYTQASAYFTHGSGETATYTDTSDVVTAVNKSTVDVILGVDVTVANVTTNPVTFTESTAVNTGTDKNVFVGLVPTATGTVKNDAAAVAGEVKTEKATAVGATGKASLSFYVAGDTDNFTITQADDSSVKSGHAYTYKAKDGTGEQDATWNTVGFALKAACNTNADWTDFNAKSQLTSDDENLKPTIAYSMDPLTDDQKAQMSAEQNPKTADAETGVIKFDTDAAPTGFGGSDAFTMTLGSESNELTLNLGVGTLASTVSKIDLLYGEDFSTVYALTADKDYTLTGGNSLKLISADGSIFKSGESGSYKIKVTFADNSTSTCDLSANAAS